MKDDLAAFVARCEACDLLELGHLLFTAPTTAHRRLAERIISRRLAESFKALPTTVEPIQPANEPGGFFDLHSL